jgi:hypothetical protein
MGMVLIWIVMLLAALAIFALLRFGALMMIRKLNSNQDAGDQFTRSTCTAAFATIFVYGISD